MTDQDISNAAVKKATGKEWEQLFTELDTLMAKHMSHKERVALIREKLNIDNSWWQQTIAVRYEQARGLRKIGQTLGAGFEIGVSKTLPVTVEELWLIMTTSPGRDIWLGHCPDISFEKNFSFITEEKTTGEIRSMSQHKRIRLTYQPKDRDSATTLQLSFEPKGEKTVLRFHQEKLSGTDEREAMRAHWKKVIAKLESLI